MDSNEVAKGIIHSRNISDGISLLAWEMLIVSIGAGLLSQSWFIGGGVCLAFLAMIKFRQTAIPLAFIFTLCWGALGWAIGHYIIEDTGASVFIAILALILTGGLHASVLGYSLFNWSQDGHTH